MFCSQCGKQCKEDEKFCSGCGASTTGTAEVKQETEKVVVKPNNKVKIVIGVGAVVAVAVIVWFVFLGGGGLRGTWVCYHHRDRTEARPYIQFSGSRFTMVSYGIEVNSGGRWQWNGYIIPGGISNRGLPETRMGGVYRQTDTRRYRQVTHTGRFSISGDTIEFVFSCGAIRTGSFSETQNTITIRGARLVRR